MISSEAASSHPIQHPPKFWWGVLLSATALNCAIQIAWFWRFHARNITTDGIAYIGLARHLVDGNFKSSLHGYWSPLSSWLIAAATVFSRDFTLVGRIVTIASFLACLPLLYVLTLKLWDSRTAAALAVFWFSAARGIIATAVGMILADFVLTATVLLYFILLLAALRKNDSRSWISLGLAHALAFLAKAIAMPWLSISTLLGVLWRNLHSPRRSVTFGLLALLLPAAVWVGWGVTLRSKYGVFTTGYQLRRNLMVNWHRRFTHHPRGDDQAFTADPGLNDKYMVGDAWSQVRTFTLPDTGFVRLIIDTEMQNLPRAAKETAILLTPAGALAFPMLLFLLARRSDQYQAQRSVAYIALISSVSLIAAYCMLVFDGRYVIPLAPVLIAIGCPLLLPPALAPAAPHLPRNWQKTGLALLLASMVFFAVYWASPFRTASRDYEISCYQGADTLRQAAPTGTLVSIGAGPYPEHGVGFEAGPYIAYLSGWRLIGLNSALPPLSSAEDLRNQVLAVHADAVAVWGTPADSTYRDMIAHLRIAPGLTSSRPIPDPYKGEVGTIFVFTAGRFQSRWPEGNPTSYR